MLPASGALRLYSHLWGSFKVLDDFFKGKLDLRAGDREPSGECERRKAEWLAEGQAPVSVVKVIEPVQFTASRGPSRAEVTDGLGESKAFPVLNA